MEVVCESCKSKFKVPDEKIPKDKIIKVKCPKCGSPISLGKIKEEAYPETFHEEVHEEEVKIDYYEQGVRSCLVCVEDSELKDMIEKGLKELGYEIAYANSAKEAIVKMRFTKYDLLVLCEDERESNIVWQNISTLPMQQRRGTFVVMITDRFNTGDGLSAYSLSVNLVLNKEDMPRFVQVLKGEINDYERFYKVFNETLERVGKA